MVNIKVQLIHTGIVTQGKERMKIVLLATVTVLSNVVGPRDLAGFGACWGQLSRVGVEMRCEVDCR